MIEAGSREEAGASPAELRPGSRLGRYRCLVPLAQGGMGSVWVASLDGARGFHRTFAVKVMLPTLRGDPSYTQMLLNEAMVASRIHHPNVVPVHDVGEQDGLLFTVLEWVEGENLHTVMTEMDKRRRRLPLSFAARIVVDACKGLQAAHDLADDDGVPLGLVHRDVSPHNLIVSLSGLVRLTDFGIVRTVATAGQTAPGQIRGKIHYMAPEQAIGQKLDRRTDVFAMGVVLYELLAGAHPFKGRDELETLQLLLAGKFVSPRESEPAIPRALESVVMKALARTPHDRFSSAAELGGAIEDAFRDTPLASDQELADFMEATVGAAVRDRANSIRSVARDLGAVEDPPPSSGLATPAPAVTAIEGPATTTGLGPLRRRLREHRWITGLLAGVAIGALALAAVRRPGAGSSGSPEAASGRELAPLSPAPSAAASEKTSDVSPPAPAGDVDAGLATLPSPSASASSAPHRSGARATQKAVRKSNPPSPYAQPVVAPGF